MTVSNKNISFLKYKIEVYFSQPVDFSDSGIKYLLSVPFPLDEEQIKLILSIIKEMRRSHNLARDEYELDVINYEEGAYETHNND